jgi:hypothetical protein
MGFQVFLIPSLDDHEQAIVWQLQTLAQSYGITLKTAKRTRFTLLSSSDSAEIQNSDAVVVIVTKPLGSHSTTELGKAQTCKKPIFWLIEQQLASSLKPRSLSVAIFDRDESISEVAKKIESAMKGQKGANEAKIALGWLLSITAALFILDTLAAPDNT